MQERDSFHPETFHFRSIHPLVYLGTASDRYAGWIGQVYTGELYKDRISRRTNRIKGKNFKEEVLPVDSVSEYFEHFRVLEIDYTFYRPLLDRDGKESQSYHVLRSYRDRLGPGDFLILKVPQAVCAQKILHGGKYEENEDYLRPDLFTRSFYEPARELLGEHLRGFIFEQEYQRKKERSPAERVAEDLGKFFQAIPRDDRYHVELRTESYLSPPVFSVLEQFGVGQVLSHWTWLPRLAKQFDLSERRFLNAGNSSVVRLMTPIGTRYEDAYARAHPFDKMVEGMLQPSMIEDTVALLREATEQNVAIHVLVNNRSGGNAPLIAREIANHFPGDSTPSGKRDRRPTGEEA